MAGLRHLKPLTACPAEVSGSARRRIPGRGVGRRGCSLTDGRMSKGMSCSPSPLTCSGRARLTRLTPLDQWPYLLSPPSFAASADSSSIEEERVSALYEQRGGVFEEAFDALDEGGGVVAVYDAVI